MHMRVGLRRKTSEQQADICEIGTPTAPLFRLDQAQCLQWAANGRTGHAASGFSSAMSLVSASWPLMPSESRRDPGQGHMERAKSCKASTASWQMSIAITLKAKVFCLEKPYAPCTDAQGQGLL